MTPQSIPVNPGEWVSNLVSSETHLFVLLGTWAGSRRVLRTDSITSVVWTDLGSSSDIHFLLAAFGDSVIARSYIGHLLKSSGSGWANITKSLPDPQLYGGYWPDGVEHEIALESATHIYGTQTLVINAWVYTPTGGALTYSVHRSLDFGTTWQVPRPYTTDPFYDGSFSQSPYWVDPPAWPITMGVSTFFESWTLPSTTALVGGRASLISDGFLNQRVYDLSPNADIGVTPLAYVDRGVAFPGATQTPSVSQTPESTVAVSHDGAVVWVPSTATAWTVAPTNRPVGDVLIRAGGLWYSLDPDTYAPLSGDTLLSLTERPIRPDTNYTFPVYFKGLPIVVEVSGPEEAPVMFLVDLSSPPPSEFWSGFNKTGGF